MNLRDLLNYNQGIAENQQAAKDAHWCVATELGDPLITIMIQLTHEGVIDQQEFVNIQRDFEF